jgi:hypothetical protein
MPHGKMIRPLLIALFLSVCSVSSWAQSPPIVGATIQTAHYDPQTKAITIRILNTSQRDITAYNITLAVTYADGTSGSSELATDFIGPMIHGRPGFTAGTSHDEVTSETKAVTNTRPVLDVVVYSDQTAEVQNERAFKQLVARRQAKVLAHQKVNEVINQVLADPTVGDPGLAAATELKRLADVLNARNNIPFDNPEAWIKDYLRETSDQIRSKPSNRDSLAAIVKNGENEIAIATPHTQLTKKGVAQ